MSDSQTLDEPATEHPAPVWFVAMYEAVERGDYARAADYQAELARLGWRVDRKPRRKARAVKGGGR